MYKNDYITKANEAGLQAEHFETLANTTLDMAQKASYNRRAAINRDRSNNWLELARKCS